MIRKSGNQFSGSRLIQYLELHSMQFEAIARERGFAALSRHRPRLKPRGQKDE
jgi:hypothetical protein